MKLGILTSHPIQYQTPWFCALAKEVDLEVFFAHRQSASEQGKAGFGVAFDWDVDLLSGYKHRFLKNVSTNPGVSHFAGCDTPEIRDIVAGPRTTHNESTGKMSGPLGKRFDAFVLCGWYLKSYLQAARACRGTGIPVLVRGDSHLRTPRSALKQLVMEFRQRWLLRQFDGFLSVGQRHHEYLEHFGVPSGKIFFVPHFVDNEWFTARAEEARGRRSEIRKQWGAAEGELIALFVGKFIPKKRPGDLLRAMAQLRVSASEAGGGARFWSQTQSQQSGIRESPAAGASHKAALQGPGPNIFAVFVGAGELEKELSDFVDQEKLRVHFAGFKNQTELPACYVAADVLVLPSESETWGLSVNEAMACGTPAIVSDAVGSAPDLIMEGRTGFTFRWGDQARLADRLGWIWSMKQNGHDFTPALTEKLSTYSVEAATAETIRAVEKLSEQLKS